MTSLRNPWSSPPEGGALYDSFSNSTKMVDLLPNVDNYSSLSTVKYSFWNGLLLTMPIFEDYSKIGIKIHDNSWVLMNYREISWFLTHQKNVCSIPFKWWCKMSIFKGGGTRSGGRISALPATPNSALSSNNIPRIAIMLSKKKTFKSRILSKNRISHEAKMHYHLKGIEHTFFWRLYRNFSE